MNRDVPVQESLQDLRTAEYVARFLVDSAAYSLACAVADDELWTPAGMIAAESVRAERAEVVRQRRAEWLAAEQAVRDAGERKG